MDCEVIRNLMKRNCIAELEECLSDAKSRFQSLKRLENTQILNLDSIINHDVDGYFPEKAKERKLTALRYNQASSFLFYLYYSYS